MTHEIEDIQPALARRVTRAVLEPAARTNHNSSPAQRNAASMQCYVEDSELERIFVELEERRSIALIV
jgi:hypothetical protein